MLILLSFLFIYRNGLTGDKCQAPKKAVHSPSLLQLGRREENLNKDFMSQGPGENQAQLRGTKYVYY